MAKKTIGDLDLNSVELDKLVTLANEILSFKKQQDALVVRLSDVLRRIPAASKVTAATKRKSTATASKKRSKPVGTHTSRAAGVVFRKLQERVTPEVKDLGPHHKKVPDYGKKVKGIWDKVQSSGEGLKAINALGAEDQKQVHAKIAKVLEKLKTT